MPKLLLKNFTSTQINFTSVGSLFLCIILPLSWDESSWDESSWDESSWDESSWDESSGLVRSAIFAGMLKQLRGCG